MVSVKLNIAGRSEAGDPGGEEEGRGEWDRAGTGVKVILHWELCTKLVVLVVHDEDEYNRFQSEETGVVLCCSLWFSLTKGATLV